MKKSKILLFFVVALCIAALASVFIKHWMEPENTLEKEGLASILSKVRETEEFPERSDIAYLSAQITEKGAVTDFTLTLEGFDQEEQYVSHVGYVYDSDTEQLDVREYKETSLPVYYDPNADFDYVDSQIRRIPFEAQIRLLDFQQYQVEFRQDTQLAEGVPVMDGSSGQEYPVLTYEEYLQGQGGISDGSSAVVISLSDGTQATANCLEYYCKAADQEALEGHPESVMQMDYRIDQGDLSLTWNAGETWISTGLSEDQVTETTETYQRGGLLFEDSYYADPDGVLAVFYGKNPILRLSGDGGQSWEDVPFYEEMPRLCTRRIIRFLDEENGYAGLGTDWTMGTGGATYLYWTHDGGRNWTVSSSLYEDGLMLDGLAFSDTENGIASLQTVNGDEQWPVLRATKDGGQTFLELTLPWDSLPSELSFLDKVDSLTVEDGTFTLVLGQGTAGNRKAVFTSTDLLSGWKFQESYTGTIHTVG